MVLNKIKNAVEKGYKIDHEGRVYSPYGKELKLIKSNVKRNINYYFFNVRFCNKSQPVYVHRVQAFLKYGDIIFEKGVLVRHLDGNSLNNSFTNIEIGSHSDNMMDIDPKIRKSKSSKANLIHDHKSIIKDRMKGMTYLELMKKYDISSKSTISFIINKSISSEN